MTQAIPIDSAYRPLAEPILVAYLTTIPAVVEILGGAPAEWSVREVGDGNLNLVFIVKGGAAASRSSRRCLMCGWSARAGRHPCRARISSISP